MSDTTNAAKSGAPWLLILFVALLIAKFSVAPALPWVAVFAPVIFVAGLLSVAAVLFLVVGIAAFIDHVRR